MIRVLLQRLVQAVPVLVLLSMLVFAGTALLPGDPAQAIVGEYATAGQLEQARQAYGLDHPLPVRYAIWAEHVLQGDLGRSLRSREPVAGMLLARIPVTVELALLAALFAGVAGVPLGILAALRRGHAADHVANLLAMGALAMPSFWIGVLLILCFSIWLGLVPPSGYVPFLQDPLENLRLMALPALTLSLHLTGTIIRQTRASVLGVLRQDYVRTAQAKGLTSWRVVTRHVLRNALVPVISVASIQLGLMLGGAVVTETIFSLPGLGRLLVEAIYARDFPVVQGAVLFVVLVVIAVNLLADLAYALADPRFRDGGA